MSYRSQFYGIVVRDEIAREFADTSGQVDDMLAGLHEIRARLRVRHPVLKALARRRNSRRRSLRTAKGAQLHLTA